MSPTILAGYLALFAGLGMLFLAANLVVGWFLRPRNPHPEKLEVYECGEPTIGSSFVQFDLRFYVVALLFIIFDVEVAFFFPWATVFGKANHLRDPSQELVVATSEGARLTEPAARVLRELGVPDPQVANAGLDAGANETALRQLADTLTATAAFDILAFFAILLVGFAYVWKRGDLDWVRAITHQRGRRDRAPPPSTPEREPALI